MTQREQDLLAIEDWVKKQKLLISIQEQNIQFIYRAMMEPMVGYKKARFLDMTLVDILVNGDLMEDSLFYMKKN
jgi:hypothetical protein